MVNNVLTQSGFLEIDTLTGSTDPDEKQLLGIANRVVREIRDYYPWPALRKTVTIGLTPEQKLYDLPAGFRRLIADSVWELDGTRAVEWPTPNGRWYRYKFSTDTAGPTVRIRQLGNQIEVEGNSSEQEIALEFLSGQAVLGPTGLEKSLFDDDTDTFLLSDRILELGIQAHWAETKMLPQAQRWMANYMQARTQAIAQEEGARTIGGRMNRGSRGAPHYPLWRK